MDHLAGVEGSHSMGLIHMPGKLVLAVDRRPLSPVVWTSPHEGPQDVSTGFPIASAKSESGSHNAFYDLALKLTLSLLS